MLSRKFRLKFDISNYDIFKIPDIKFCLMDTNSSTLFVEVLDEGSPLDLGDMTVSLYVSKPDGTEVLIECENEDMTNGLVKFTLPTQALAITSENYNAEIRLLQNGRCVILRPFNYSVIENLSSGDSQITSTNDYVLLVNALSRLLEIESHENSRIINEETRIANEEQRKKDVSKAIGDINSKITEFNTVKNNVESTVKEKVLQVDNKIVEIGNSMDVIKGRFDSLSPEESTNAEVQLARTDAEGITHDSIQSRLLKIETMPSVIYETVEG